MPLESVLNVTLDKTYLIARGAEALARLAKASADAIAAAGGLTPLSPSPEGSSTLASITVDKWGRVTAHSSGAEVQTLQGAYNLGVAGPQVIAEDATRLGVVFRGRAGAAEVILGAQDSAGTTEYFGVYADHLQLGAAGCPAKLYETGTASLAIGAITDGYLLKRVGTDIVSVDPATIGVTAHGSLTGLTGTDHHTQYALLAGRSGGQTLIGGTGTTDDLILRATSGVGASGSDIIFQVGNNGGTEAARCHWTGTSAFWGFGTNDPTATLHANYSDETDRAVLRMTQDMDTDAGGFTIDLGTYGNSVPGRKNITSTWGYNKGAAKAAEPVWNLNIETNYSVAPYTWQKCEFQINYGLSGFVARPYQVEVDRLTNTIGSRWESYQFDWWNNDSTLNWMKWVGTTTGVLKIMGTSVGVGIAAPESTFHVFNSQNATTAVNIENPGSGVLSCSAVQFGEDISGGTATGGLYYFNGNYTLGAGYEAYAKTSLGLVAKSDMVGGVEFVTVGNAPISFYTGGPATANQRMTISGTGLVGIGGAVESNYQIKVTTAQAVAFAIKNTSGTGWAGFELRDEADAAKGFFGWSNQYDHFRLNVMGAPAYFMSSSEEVFTILPSTYYVGVGHKNTTPDATLHVYDATSSGGITTLKIRAGNAQTTADLLNAYANNGTTKLLGFNSPIAGATVMQLSSAGSGTTSYAQLAVVNNTNVNGAIVVKGSGASAYGPAVANDVLVYTSGTKLLFMADNASGAFGWATGASGGTEKMTLSSTGLLTLNPSTTPQTALLLDIAALTGDGTRDSHSISWKAHDYSSAADHAHVWTAHIEVPSATVLNSLWTLDCSYDGAAAFDVIQIGAQNSSPKGQIKLGEGLGDWMISPTTRSTDAVGRDLIVSGGVGGSADNNGGSLYLRGGAKDGTAADGSVYIGDSVCSGVYLGSASCEVYVVNDLVFNPRDTLVKVNQRLDAGVGYKLQLRGGKGKTTSAGGSVEIDGGPEDGSGGSGGVVIGQTNVGAINIGAAASTLGFFGTTAIARNGTPFTLNSGDKAYDLPASPSFDAAGLKAVADCLRQLLDYLGDAAGNGLCNVTA